MNINNIIIRIYITSFRFFIAYIHLSIFYNQTASADVKQNLEDAHKKQITAYAEFYQGVKNLGLNPPKDKYLELKRKTVDAAQFDFTRAKQIFLFESKQDLMKRINTILAKNLPGFISLEFIKREKKQKQSQSPKPTSIPPPQAPELILDGSKVLKEIEFFHNKQNETPLPTAIEGEGHTDTIEFTPSHPSKKK